MIYVYFESSSHAELVATFQDDTLYMRCLPILEAYADECGMTVTDSENDAYLEIMEML